MTRNYKTDIKEENATIIDIYNEQIDYLTTKDLDFLEVFDEFIGDIEIKYNPLKNPEIRNQIDVYDIINNTDEVYYTIGSYGNLLKRFNLDFYDVLFEISNLINYAKLDKKIIEKIFEDSLNVETLEDLHNKIRYYELDALRVLDSKLTYNKTNNYIEGRRLIADLLTEYKKEYEYIETLSETITNTVLEISDEYITDQIQRKIIEYNRYNVPYKIKKLYEYAEY